MTAITTYRVTGMTCDHCIRAVTDEVIKLAGVTDVKVDLRSGDVTITSDHTVDDRQCAPPSTKLATKSLGEAPDELCHGRLSLAT